MAAVEERPWEVKYIGQLVYAVIPLNDIYPHNDGKPCHCSPRTETMANGGIVIIHNSFDGRELEEHETKRRFLQ
jgi:hypothetical protein